MQELQDVIVEAMAEQFEAAHAQPPSISELSPLMAGDLSGRMTPPMAADLAGRMTPPMATDLAERMTPPNSAAAAAGRTSPLTELSRCLEQELSASPARRRRSSVMQCRRLSVAVNEVCSLHSQNLAKAAAHELKATTGDGNAEEVAAEIRQCVLSSHRRQRQSILQAAEVLEAAGIGEDSDEESSVKERLTSSEVTAQLQFVQKAVEGA